MNIVEILLISIGLAMDAFAVAVCKGLSMKRMNWKKAIIVGIYFGIFQAVMPIIGYFIAIKFENIVEKVDHWFAFVLLGAIGIKMIKEAIDVDNEGITDSIKFKEMTILAIATSIDALAIGITFAFLKTNIVFPVLSIGIITLVLATIGVKIGNRFGTTYENKAEFVGGIILIILGVKILLEHTGILYKII